MTVPQFKYHYYYSSYLICIAVLAPGASPYLFNFNLLWGIIVEETKGFSLKSCYPLFYFETIFDFLENSFEVHHLLNPAGSHALLWVSEIIYSLCLF